MAFTPTVKIYDSSLVFVYTIPYVNFINAPQSSKKYTTIEGIRGNGCIVVQGSTESWDLVIKGTLVASSYEALVTAMDEMESKISECTQFYIKIQKSDSEYYTYKVRRLLPIEYSESLRINTQGYQLTLKVNSW